MTHRYHPQFKKNRQFMENEGQEYLTSQTWWPKTQAYPPGWCAPTSSLVSKMTGLYLVSGFYKVGEEELPHVWNYDPYNNLEIDLTLDQFSITSQKIYLGKEGYVTRKRHLGLETLPTLDRITEFLLSEYKKFNRITR